MIKEIILKPSSNYPNAIDVHYDGNTADCLGRGEALDVIASILYAPNEKTPFLKTPELIEEESKYLTPKKGVIHYE